MNARKTLREALRARRITRRAHEWIFVEVGRSLASYEVAAARLARRALARGILLARDEAEAIIADLTGERMCDACLGTGDDEVLTPPWCAACGGHGVVKHPSGAMVASPRGFE